MNRVDRFIKITCIFLISLFSKNIAGQTDTEFWFVAPEITVNHGPPGGIPANLRFATFNLPATITISMPANTALFPDIVVNVLANSTGTVNLSNWINLAGVEQNKLENKTLTASGINNFGIRITSTSIITAYYEINNDWNSDIWALKGKNALGTNFYTPFQNHGNNGSYAADPTQNTYSAIDIVATENNTTVWVTPARNAGYGNGGATIAANVTQAFTLQRGQTLSIYPQGKSRAALDHLGGSRVTSNKNIAISLKDDSIIHPSGGCRDVAGDQIVPVNVIGTDYIVMRTFLNTQDYAYVVATQPNTPIFVDGVQVATISAGQQYQVLLPNPGPNFRRISSRLLVTDPYRPIYVFHIGGFGCEQGGAICPPIDVCTGSTLVAFTRPKTAPFFLTMMVRDGAQNGFLFDGAVRNDLIPPASFTLVPGTPWRVARFGPYSIAQISQAQHLIENTMDIFHLGIVNGDAGTTCMYGYFSDFNVFDPAAVVVQTGSAGNTICYGESVLLLARGGTRYEWKPSDFLENPFSDSTWARNITKVPGQKYTVVVGGVCGLEDSTEIVIDVEAYMNAKFTTDVFSGCAPLTVNVINNSIGVGQYKWSFGDGSPDVTNFTGAPPPHVYDNLTNDTIRYELKLLAVGPNGICIDLLSKTILVYPRIQASFTTTIADGKHCHPLSVIFNNTSTFNGSSYTWDFGDGGSSYLVSPTHVYSNFDNALKTFTGNLLVTDKYNKCTANAPISIDVQPYLKASFVVDPIEGCSPLTITIINDSKGATDYNWDRDGDGIYENSGEGSGTYIYTNPTITNAIMTVPIRLRALNTANCSDVITRTITVYPRAQINTLTINDFGNGLGCSPLTNNYTATTANSTLSHWLIDGNAFNNTLSATYTYNNFTTTPINKVVSLTANNQWGCSVTRNENIMVQPFVEAQFVADKEVGCSPLDVTFLNTTSIGVTGNYQWYIGGSIIPITTTNIATQTFSNILGTNTPITMPVRLVASNAIGCSDDLTKNIVINPQTVASFTYIDAANLNHCSPFSTNFTSVPTNNETYQWEFGSYGASNIANPAFSFINNAIGDVTVPVTLTTNNSSGCPATSTQNIIVRPGVKALFSIDKTAGCPPYNATVSANTAPAIINYTWDFDGTPFTGANQIFSNPSNISGLDVTKNISLTVSSGFCSDNVTKSIVVYPQVEALFTPIAVTSGCSPFTVNFENTSRMYGTNVPISNIVWDFNDNSTAITSPLNHTFVNPDNTIPQVFNVTLTATTSNGCIDFKTIPITANPSVTAAFNSLVIQPCTPVRINIKDASIAGPTISTFTWTYAGGVLLPPEDKDFDIDFDNIDPVNPINRTVTLDLSNTFGCTSSKSQNFVIDPKVSVAMALTAPVDGGGVPIDRQCAPALFTFSNNSTGAGLTYTWDFKDGVTQTVNTTIPFDHTFENRTAATKQFDVQLSAINLMGCSNSATRSVWVYPEVDAKYSMTRDSSCTPFFIRLKDESLNGTQWSWDFGHTILGVPQTRTSIVPGETFTKLIDNETVTDQIKKYKINLTLDDLVTGCKDTISQFLDVYPRVISNFTVTPISDCSPITITFTNNSTGLGSYLWELDNGISFTQPNPIPLSITNTSTVNEKIVNVKLTATNTLNCKSVSNRTVTIAPKVLASFTSSILEGCDPFTAIFSNLTPSTAYNYSWSVDGIPQVVTQDYSRAFTNLTNPPIINKYKILLESSYKLNATCKDTVSKFITVYPRVYPNFTFSNTVGCHPLTTDLTNTTVSFNNSASYTWNLGNGTFSTLQNLADLKYRNNSATKDTIYSIKLIARSIHQCVDSISKSITVHPRPIASYVMNNESVKCSPFDIELHNHSIGTGLEYDFDLDDGTLINTLDRNQVITHTYHNTTNDVKSYDIVLTATTLFGCSNSTSQTVFAYPEVKADLTLSANAGCSPITVGFTSATKNGYFNQWSFGDGTNSNLLSPNHRFVNTKNKDKIFDVHLRSISAYDCEDDTTVQVTAYATPVANFSINPPLKTFPDATFNFHNQSNPDTTIWAHNWNFGDGFTSNAMTPADHTYLQWGPKNNDFIYNTMLIVTAPNCADTTYNILRLLPAAPIPFFTADIYKSCSPLEAHFVNASEYGSNFEWSFGDGTFSTDEEPIHTFKDPGYYIVKLTVFGDGGNSYYYRTFRVFQNPVASFAVYPNRVMLPDAEVHVYNLTMYGHRYEWELNKIVFSTDKDPVIKFDQLGEYQIGLRAFSHDTLGPCQDYISVYPAVWVEGQGVIKFPDAFVPSKLGSNGGVYDDIDYKNEVFHPIHYGVTEYKLMIFNRWGEQVFQSDDVKQGWDGYYKGKLCEQGVYVWRAVGKYTNGRAFDQKGNLTLLR